MKRIHCICVAVLAVSVCVPVLAQQPDADVIITEAGGLIHCTVQAIGADGSVQVTGPWLKGEARVELAGLRQIMLGSPAGRLDQHRVYITNGDIIEGNVVAVTAKHVKIGSGPLGAVDIPRSVVERIDLRHADRILFEMDFARDGMGPWKTITGVWKIENGLLACVGRGDGEKGGAMMVAPFEHEGSVTFEYRYTAKRGVHRMAQTVMLYADDIDAKGKFREGLSITFKGSKGLAICRRSANKEKANSANNIFKEWADDYRRKHLPAPTGDAAKDRDAYSAVINSAVTVTVRVACDLENEKVLLWVDGRQYVNERMMDMPNTGKHILLGDSWVSSQMQYIRVLQGVIPPPDVRDEGEKESYIFLRKDGTRAISPTFTLKDGQITVGRGVAQYAIALSDVKEIIMPGDGRTQPRHRKGDAWVRTQLGRVSLRITSLTGEHLTGSSDYMGDIRVVRTAIKAIVPNPPVTPEQDTP